MRKTWLGVCPVMGGEEVVRVQTGWKQVSFLGHRLVNTICLYVLGGLWFTGI